MSISSGKINALRAQRYLDQSVGRITSTYERLSSGQRINRASDDAAGLAIADSLRNDNRVYSQATRNLNDGISYFNIADGALQELSNISIRIKELAEQAANGTLGATQRLSLDKEAQELSKEFQRIVTSTSFNGISILNGSNSTVALQGGYGTDGILQGSVGGAIGSGSFSSGHTYLMENRTSSDVLLKDFNSDGVLDMLSVGQNSGMTGNMTVRIGNGDGSFGAAISSAIAVTQASDITAADLNNDGILDLVAGDFGNGSLFIKLGCGDGSFSSQVSFANVATYTGGIITNDFNNDGKLDIATAGVGSGTGQLSIAFGNGNGTFRAAVLTGVTGSTSGHDLDAGDIDRDGVTDLIVSGIGGGVGVNYFFKGTGAGTFSLVRSFSNGTVASGDTHIGDLNGDGALDLVTAAGAGNTASVALGNGDGTFGVSTAYNVGTTYTGEVDIADLNSDGILDLISQSDNAGSGAVMGIRLGNGNGTFGVVTSYSLGGTYGLGSAFGDVNGDGVLDIAMMHQVAGPATRIGIMLARVNNGTAGINPFSLRDIGEAKQTLSMLAKKIDLLAKQRGEIGAFQSRSNVALNVLYSTRENVSSAEAQIRDSDVAEDAAKLVREQILQKASSAVLSQAQMGTKLVFDLIGK